MAKSKIAKTANHIAEVVTDSYKVYEKGVVDGYKRIESSVIGAYSKVEDKFVDTFLTKDGESISEAKERLRRQTK